jgi:hypothetical protein
MLISKPASKYQTPKGKRYVGSMGKSALEFESIKK